MKNIKLFLAILFIVLLPLNAGQNYHFKLFPDLEKLSNKQATDFFQDSYGFMWIATSDGLNRYDGNSVKIYKNIQGDVESLPDNATMQIIEDAEKNLWVACYNAIGKLDRKTDKFTRYSLENLPFKSPPNFFSAMLDKEGVVWFSLRELGLIRYDKKTDKFVNVELSISNSSTTWGEVHIITQLRNGLILAADVANGIKAYNSSTGKFDPYYLKPGYSPKAIYRIYEGSAGNVWLTGGERIIKFSPIQYSVKEINLIKYSRVNSSYSDHNHIVEDDNGFLWVSVYTHGLFKIDKQFTTFDQYSNATSNPHSLPDNKINALFKDKYGIIWISFLGGEMAQLDPNSNPFEYYSINSSSKNSSQNIIRSISQAPLSKAEIVLGTSSDGILLYNLESKNVTKRLLNDNTIKSDSNNTVNDLAIDYSGNIWYSINNSPLKKYNVKTKKIEPVDSPHSGKTAQPMAITSINVSPDNKIWVSSNYGVDIYDPVRRKFSSVPRIMNKSISKELEESISKIRKSTKPISSITEVGEGQNLEEKFTILKDTKVILLCIGEGRAIGGVFDRGGISSGEGNAIWEMSDIYSTFYAGGGFKNRLGIKLLSLTKGEYSLNYISDIGHSFNSWNTLPPKDSSYWGIQAYEVSDVEYKRKEELLNQELKNDQYLPFEFGRETFFSKMNSNKVWIGSNTNSFFQYDLSTGGYTQYNFDPTNLSDASHYIYCFYEDLDGILWVGTYASFLRVDVKSNSVNVFTTADGLPGGNIYGIVEDDFGALWIYSSGGLSKLNKNAPIKKYSFVNYNAQDGIEGLTTSTAVFKDESGKLFFGGKGGLISFTPGIINVVEPDIVIYDFKIDDVSIFADSSNINLDKSIYEVEKIELSYNQNDISFEFSAIHSSRSGKNKITYQLEGFNNRWYESDRNFASFTNLDPGEYTFHVKGANGDGIWNEKGRTISIIISSPIWQTWWAYIVYLLGFLLLLYVIRKTEIRRQFKNAKIRESQLRAEAAELQAKAAEAQAIVMQAENDRKTEELEEARQLQLSMLPKELPALQNLDIAVYMKTATEVGGDYYDFNVSIDGTLTVVLGDATGHGMKAGTMVTTTKSLFNVLAPNPKIVETFHEMTRCLKLMHMDNLSMCMTMLKITGNKLQFSSAGMPPVFLFRKETKVIEEHLLEGMPLGTMNNFPYELSEITLSEGDTLLMLSDGLPELQNNSSQLYGYKRVSSKFEEVAEKSSEEIISHLKDDGSRWVENNDPEDDVTFVVIKVK